MSSISEQDRLSLLIPDWPAPSNILACTAKRGRVNAEDEFSWFNLALHVNDLERRVLTNREELRQGLALPSEPTWLQQVHGIDVINLAKIELDGQIPPVDASFTSKVGQVCAVLTADCLPILMTDKNGQGVVAVHAGWRGLSDGILQNTVEQFCQSLSVNANDCMAWLGPAISQKNFEVGSEVYETFKLRFGVKKLENTFAPNQEEEGKYFCDLYELARMELNELGVSDIYGGNQCTYEQEDEYFSYRRTTHKGKDRDCGRMATLIWMSSEPEMQKSIWLS